MNKELKNPKILIYENINKVVNVLDRLVIVHEGSLGDLAMEILDGLDIPYGKIIEIEPFQDNVSAELINGRLVRKVNNAE